MNRALILLAAFVVWSGVCYYAGFTRADQRADIASTRAEVKQETARADSVTAARSTDHASAQGAAKVEQKRAEQAANTEKQFQTIEREVVRYVHANPDPAGCDLDGDGLRAWRAANAGTFDAAGPDHSARSAAEDGGTAAAARKR